MIIINTQNYWTTILSLRSFEHRVNTSPVYKRTCNLFRSYLYDFLIWKKKYLCLRSEDTTKSARKLDELTVWQKVWEIWVFL